VLLHAVSIAAKVLLRMSLCAKRKLSWRRSAMFWLRVVQFHNGSGIMCGSNSVVAPAAFNAGELLMSGKTILFPDRAVEHNEGTDLKKLCCSYTPLL
jgi:hypothetical protein